MYKISKEFHFSAGHHLNGLPEDHPCSREHGHNYVVIIELEAENLDMKGFVRDYNDLKPVKEFIDNHYDHKYLNKDLMVFDDEQGMNPTAENIAKHLFDVFKGPFPELTRIGIKETPKTIAWYEA